MKTTSAEIKIYAMARMHTAMSESLDLLITDIMISKLLEYLRALNTLNTLRALAIRSKRSNLKPLFMRINEGNNMKKGLAMRGPLFNTRI